MINSNYVFQVSNEDNEELDVVFNNLPVGSEEDSIIPINIPLTAFLPYDIENYFTYEGSITTPRCNEGINWIVFQEPAFISDEQAFTIQNLPRNNRDIQDINDRTIYLNLH